MTTEEYIKARIEGLTREQMELRQSHEATVAQYQQLITQNQTRFQQLTGAIQELQSILNQPNGEKTNDNVTGNT